MAAQLERFDRAAQDVMSHAAALALHYGHRKIDTEHVLRALLRDLDGISSRLLLDLAVDVSAVRSGLDERLRARSSEQIESEDQLKISGRVIRIIDRAFEEADRAHAWDISPEHIFLAALNEPSAARTILYEQEIIYRSQVVSAIRRLHENPDS